MDRSASDKQLIDAFVQAARRHGDASDAGNYRRANREYDIANAIAKELQSRVHGSRKLLLQLLKDHDPWVRYWAAVTLRTVAPSEATAVIAELARAKPTPVLGLDATLVLREWQKEQNPNRGNN